MLARGVRGGAATLFYPLWHLEVESLLVLKNNRGVDDNRVRHLDYGVQLNKLMYERLIKGQNITYSVLLMFRDYTMHSLLIKMSLNVYMYNMRKIKTSAKNKLKRLSYSH